MNKPKRNSILLPLSVASLLGFITKPAPFHRPGARRGVVRNHRCMCGCGGKIKACRRASRYSKYVPENLVGPRVRQGVSAKMRKLARFIAKPDGTIHLPSVMRQRLAAA